MRKIFVRADITVPVEIEIELEDKNVVHHGSTQRAIEAAVEEMANTHVIFSDMFDRGQVFAVENVDVRDWDDRTD